MCGAHFIHESSSCAHDVVVLILYDSPSTLCLQSPLSSSFSFTLFFTFFFHVWDKNAAHSRERGPWHPCRERSSHRLRAQRPGDNRSLNLHDLEFDDYTIGMALSSPLFTQEREDAASCRQAYHSPDEGLSSSQSSSVGHVRTPCRSSENEQIRILLERQREQILADFQAEIQKHEFQADYDRRTMTEELSKS